ncbi:MAG: tellurite resistance TerB family protein [Geminicoccaceae bacterium]|nr:tellurite resistance TerB family protein [Geminicoccaceae bacterium]MCB9943433.1 tellurite resistance TerB family protein [Geminicoccaceae bacterium]
MFDAEKLLRGLASGGLSRGTMAKGGGMALLGGLAIAAFEHFSQQQSRRQPDQGMSPGQPPAAPGGHRPPPLPGGGGAPPPLPGSVLPASGSPAMPPPLPGRTAAAMPASPDERHTSSAQVSAGAAQDRAILLIRAMIAAAKADGAIDDEERAAILGRIDEQELGQEAHDFVEAEMNKPLDLYEITSAVRDEATAAEVYAASLLAITVDTDDERRYLNRLAARLGLDEGTVAAIEARLTEPGQPPASR